MIRSIRVLFMTLGVFVCTNALAEYESAFLRAFSEGTPHCIILAKDVDPNLFLDIGLGESKGRTIFYKLLAHLFRLSPDRLSFRVDLLRVILQNRPNVNLPIAEEGQTTAFEFFLIQTAELNPNQQEQVRELFNLFIAAGANTNGELAQHIFDDHPNLKDLLKQAQANSNAAERQTRQRRSSEHGEKDHDEEKEQKVEGRERSISIPKLLIRVLTPRRAKRDARPEGSEPPLSSSPRTPGSAPGRLETAPNIATPRDISPLDSPRENEMTNTLADTIRELSRSVAQMMSMLRATNQRLDRIEQQQELLRRAQNELPRPLQRTHVEEEDVETTEEPAEATGFEPNINLNPPAVNSSNINIYDLIRSLEDLDSGSHSTQ